MTKRVVAIAIGVGRAARLPRLPGAVNGARGFEAWAKAMGHETHLVTDQVAAVTLTRLKETIEAALAGPPIHRLLLYFAGHGLIREAEEGLWLVSDSMTSLSAIGLGALKQRLAWYGIDQIAIFGDACRELPQNLAEAGLTPDGVVGLGPKFGFVAAVDKFIAAQDGTTTFMIPGADPDDDRCVFSGVLLEGLWGTRPDAFSKVVAKRITSQSLGNFLQKEVLALAQRYQRQVVPSWSSSFPEEDNIYFGEGAPPVAPAFPDWPEKAPAPTPPPWATLEAVPTAAHDPKFAIAPPSPSPAAHLLARVRAQPRPGSFETGAGFVVDDLRQAWAPPDVSIDQHGEQTWWRLCHHGKPILETPVPVLLELADGSVAAVTGLPSFIGALTPGAGGVAALIYREVHMPPAVAKSTEEAIAALEGRAGQSGTLVDLAIELRQGKLADPVRGVISAYLYDALGDVDSIRRMAFYYVQHGQPIPYDVALLAGLGGGPVGDTLRAHVPATKSRKPRTPAEERFDWAWSATPDIDGVVGGFWPWLRQGWAYLDEPSDVGSPLIRQALIPARKHLARGRFATLNAEGAAMLAAAFGLEAKR